MRPAHAKPLSTNAKPSPRRAAAGLALASALFALAFTVFAQVPASTPTSSTIPVRLTLQYHEESVGSTTDPSAHSSDSTQRDFSMTTSFRIPKIDYQAKNSSGKPILFTFLCDKGVLTTKSSNSQVVPGSQLTSLSGSASYSYKYNSKSDVGTENDAQSGAAKVTPDKAKFAIYIRGEKIQLTADSGPFTASGQSDSSAGSRAIPPHDVFVHTMDFSMDGSDNPSWTITTHWTGSGWTGSTKWHTTYKASNKSSDVLNVLTFTFDLLPSKFELKYGETSLDVPLLIKCGKPVDHFVYDLGENAFLPHANFAGQVLIDGENQVHINEQSRAHCPGPPPQPVTSSYKILRLARSWCLDAQGNAKGASNCNIDHLWMPDNKEAVQDWIDLAAADFSLPAPNIWPAKRTLDEFLVAVQDHPEFGRIYVGFVIEIRPRGYRIKYSTPRSIDEAEWKRIYKSADPQFPYPFADPKEGWVDLVCSGPAKSCQWAPSSTPTP